MRRLVKRVLSIIRFRMIRFLLVGASNTAVNFIILNLVFYLLHQTKVVSSVAATTTAIVFSFALSRNFVFMDRTRPVKKFLLFSIITASGALLIQTSVFVFSNALLQEHLNTAATINTSNLIASFVVMFWNYNGYRLLVFRDDHDGKKDNDRQLKTSEA